MAQESAALRTAKCHGVADAARAERIGVAFVVGTRVPQERHHVARRREADADHLGLGRLV